MGNAVYSPLDPQTCQIRVIHLLPGKFSDPIECDLKTIQLLEDSEYEALSYVWGDAKRKLPITLCGKRVSVTRNLESALRYLRLTDSVRVIWIDALCINQKDTSERNQQVKLMRNIYQNATHVQIWLGLESTFDPASVFDTMKLLSKDATRHWSSDPSQKGKSFSPNICFMLYTFLQNPWWDRIWTVQEYVLAKQTTFVLGPHSVPGSMLRDVATSFRKHEACCISLNSRGLGGFSGGLSSKMYQLHDFQVLQEERSISALLPTIAKFRHRQATNPADKIFGLLGLTESHGDELIDYGLALNEVFEKTTIRIIQSTGNLDILSHTEMEMAPSLEALPTWAPNWTLDNYRYIPGSRHLRYHCLPLFQASKDIPAQMFPSEPGTLILEGLEVDFVEKICYSFSKSALECCSMINAKAKSQELYPSGATWLEAFWRTVWTDIDLDTKANVDERNSRLGLDTREQYSRLPACLEEKMNSMGYDGNRQSQALNGLDYDSFSPQMKENVQNSLFGSVFFLSRKGYIGMGPELTVVGDTVCILHGGRMPYILRKSVPSTRTALQDDRVPDHWKFVGDAYVHGLMDGEALGLVENNKAESRKFTLV